MRLTDYLKDKAFFLLFDVFLMLAMALLFYLLGVGTMIIVFFGTVFAGCLIVPLIIDYRKRKKYYDHFFSMADALERKNLIAELVQRPDFSEGEILYDSLKLCNKAMLEEIKAHSIAQEEYREYIEMWVHEIKTPISSSRLILENNDQVPQGLAEDLDAVENLVEQVLFYARSNAVEKDYMVRKTNVKDVVYAVARKNAKSFITRKIQFSADMPDISVNTDAKWIEFILNQIVGNAIKYCDKQNAEITVFVRKEKEAVVLHITDNGTGIPDTEVGRVFEKGFTGSNGRKQAKSTGMGLYLCARLCERLGHGIKISSENGRGTTVSLLFPENSMFSM